MNAPYGLGISGLESQHHGSDSACSLLGLFKAEQNIAGEFAPGFGETVGYAKQHRGMRIMPA